MSVFYWHHRSKWCVQWADGGKKQRRYFATEMEARSFEDERLTPTMDQMLTLGELVALYFRSNPDKHQTYRKGMVYFLAGHEECGKHVEGAGEFLRDKFAERLSRRDLERMRENVRANGSGNNTINKYQAYIRAILAWGVDQQLISINPWRDYKRLPIKKALVATNIIQIRMVYDQAEDWLKWAIKTMYALSLRPGQVELFGLTWTAFDWRRKVVRVIQGKTGRVKTVYPPAVYLEEAYARCQDDMKAGIPLVCHRAGKRVLSYKEAWKKAVKDAGLPHFPMYHIRHAAATEMLANGADLAAVAAQMGHSTITTTANTYAHVTPSGQKQAAALMSSIDDKNDA